MEKGITVPFEMQGTLNSTPERKIQIHAEKMKTAKVPVKGLLKLFGVENGHLIRAKGRAVLSSMTTMSCSMLRRSCRHGFAGGSPAPESNATALSRSSAIPLRGQDRNDMMYTGSRSHFGKLTMPNADPEINGSETSDPFDLLVHHHDQLVAGPTKTMPDAGVTCTITAA
jgi:hypothetical protein